MEQEKTYKWIQDRIRELHAGTISADDRRQLNALAQDDPFVADALEGFQSHPDTPHEKYLSSLVTRIKPYRRERRRWLIPNLTVTAVAASLMLIVGFWAVMNRLTKEDNQDFAAMETERTLQIEGTRDSTILYPADQMTPPSAHDASSAKVEVKKDEITSSSTKNSANHQQENKEIAVSAAPEKINDVAIESAEVNEADVIASAPAGATELTRMSIDDAKPELRKELLDPAYYANQMDPVLMSRRASGRIISGQGDPLIGANLMIRNTNLGTVSDLNGRFELYLPAPESLVDITYSGYADTVVTLTQGEEDVAIILPETASLSAVVVLHKSDHALSDRTAARKSDAMPKTSDGQVEFTDYLRKNSKFPLKDNLYTPGQQVTLVFSVSSNGDPSDIKVIESSGDRALDEESVRLIRKGPKWVCERGDYPCEVRYTIYFR